MRQQAVKAVREGQDVKTVATAYGVNVRSVFRWLAGASGKGQYAAAIQVCLWFVDAFADCCSD